MTLQAQYAPSRGSWFAPLRGMLSWFRRATEGQPRPGPWSLPITGGWLTPDAPGYGNYWNWWQLGGNVSQGSGSAMVEACVSAYAQTCAMCPGAHWRALDNGGRERITNSALSRILKKPNSYQTSSDFMLNLVRSLYLDGNAYALALRNNRYEVDELHLMDPRVSSPAVQAPQEDDDIEPEIIYRLGGNSVIDYRRFGPLDSPTRIFGQREVDRWGRLGAAEQLMVPGRDVLHIRLNCVENSRWPFPLVGESPLVAAYPAIGWYEKIKRQQENLYENFARPSAVLTTDLDLSREQVQELRDRWNDQAKGLHAGGVPILTRGLKVQPWTQAPPAKDMQIAEILKLTQDQIALVFRVPPAILGVVGASGGTTEQLMNNWLANGLGFCINHIEECFDRFFGLKGEPDEWTEFDTDALTRIARKERIEYLVRGVQGGIFSPNEARAKEDLPAVEFGEEPRVQQQVVPLSAAGAIPAPGPGGALPGQAHGGEGSGPPVPSAPSAPPAPPAAGAPLPTEEKVRPRLNRIAIEGYANAFDRLEMQLEVRRLASR